MSDELRDRIAAALYCHRYPREPLWGALRMARGEGMDTERGQTNCVQRIYAPMAQAIIDGLGLTVETHREHKAGSAIELDETQAEYNERVKPRTVFRIVGKWEKQ